jgi:hypothetical protein
LELYVLHGAELVSASAGETRGAHHILRLVIYVSSDTQRIALRDKLQSLFKSWERSEVFMVWRILRVLLITLAIVAVTEAIALSRYDAEFGAFGMLSALGYLIWGTIGLVRNRNS